MASVPSAPVALTALAGGPSTSQLAAPNSGTSTTSATNVARPTQAPAQSCSNGAGTNAAPAQPQTMQTSGGQTAGGAPATSRGTYRNPLVEFLLKTWIGNLVGILGLVATCIALVWTLYSGIVSLKITIWTAGNNALDTCLSLRGYGKSSRYCNETIDRGIEPPPIIRRTFPNTGNSDFFSFPMTVTATIVLTITIGILTNIYFRPRLAPFHPIISIARMQRWQTQATLSYTWQYARVVMSNISLTIRKYANGSIWTSITGNGDCTLYDDPYEPLVKDRESHQIGVSYVSDDSDDEPAELEQQDAPADCYDVEVCTTPDPGGDSTRPTYDLSRFKSWMSEHSKELLFSKMWVDRKLMSLSTGNFKELSTDVHDEVTRRQHRRFGHDPAEDILPSELRFSPKRNRARAKLSMLTTSKFSQMVKDVHDEQSRRLLVDRTDSHSTNEVDGTVPSADQRSVVPLIEACSRLLRDLRQLRDVAITQNFDLDLSKANTILDLTTTPSEQDCHIDRSTLPGYFQALSGIVPDTNPVLIYEQGLGHLAHLIPDWVGGPHNRRNLMELFNCIRAAVSGGSASNSPDVRSLQEQGSYDLFIDVVTLRGLLRYIQAVKEDLLPPPYILCDTEDHGPTETILAEPDGGSHTLTDHPASDSPLPAPSTAAKTFEDIEEPLTALDTPKDFLRDRGRTTFQTGDDAFYQSAFQVIPDELNDGILTFKIPNSGAESSIFAGIRAREPETVEDKQQETTSGLSRRLKWRAV